ncbi:hypothetical protein PVAP13_5NG628500 [Panicum virgatum]|uniref:Uncharacterized protein n=1 Tax=Panicum virgatum TaxID=38727 RepID=A0A8T0S7L2_PANVG|nr:hypothetical protein PVAP13_5NG628500 [Panicum virgatum]
MVVDDESGGAAQSSDSRNASHQIPKVLVPLRKNSFWYLFVANFRHKRFEVICPFKNSDIIKDDALVAVANFRKVFKCVKSRSTRVEIYNMPTVIGSVSSSTNQNDSGVFVLKLLLSYTGNTHFYFKPDHAKPIREMVTYYLCMHAENQIVIPEIKLITSRHGVEPISYVTRCAKK